MSAGKIISVLLLLAMAAGILIYSSDKEVTPVFETTTASDLREPVVLETLYDIPVKNYEVKKHRIRRNQFLSDIISKNGIDIRDFIEMKNAYRDVFDERRLRAGNHYSVFFPIESQEKADFLVYEMNDVDFVVYDFVRKKIYTKSKKVSLKERVASGAINSSLYQAFDDKGLDMQLGMELSDVFAWEIDFYRLQKGDRFKVIYEEKVIDGTPIGVNRILGAQFEHEGNFFYAFYFQPDESVDGDYFDESANSLRKEFLKAPLKFSRISSRFSSKRFHPVLKRYKPHLGVDYAAPTGTPILSVGDGVVEEAMYKRNNGKYVKIRHNSTYSTQYLHMSRFASGIRHGSRVKQGQVIGYVGSTGLATGPHVCFRFWKNGVQVDPLKVKTPPSKPVDSVYRGEYQKYIAPLMTQLECIDY